jgi:cell division protein FtsB
MSTLMGQARARVPRIAEAAVERARLTVVPRRAPKAARIPFVTLVSLLLVGGVVGLLLFNTSMQQASFSATAMEGRASVLDAQEQSLQMELAKLRDPQKVAERAKQLGMVPASTPAFIRLSDGKVLGKPTVAQPTDGMRITPLPVRKPKNLRPDPVILKAQKHEKNGNAADTGAASGEQGTRAGRKNQATADQNQGSRR